MHAWYVCVGAYAHVLRCTRDVSVLGNTGLTMTERILYWIGVYWIYVGLENFVLDSPLVDSHYPPKKVTGLQSTSVTPPSPPPPPP